MTLCAKRVYEVCFLLWYIRIYASNVSILFSVFPSHLPAFDFVCCDVKSLLREHKEVVRVEVSTSPSSTLRVKNNNLIYIQIHTPHHTII